MSEWFYVLSGWLITYGVFAVWIYTSREPKNLAEKDE